MTKRRVGYSWVVTEIIGSARHWEYKYVCGERTFETLESAYADGLLTQKHDDFILAQWDDGYVMAIYEGPKPFNRRDDLFHDHRLGILHHCGAAA